MNQNQYIKTLSIIAGSVTAVALAEVIREQHMFRKTIYGVSSNGKACKGRILFLSDMHCKLYGKENSELLEMIRNSEPDLILIGGDMIIGSRPDLLGRALVFLKQLSAIAPVYYGYGNHEVKSIERSEKYGKEIFSFLERVRELGITILDNSSEIVLIRGKKIRLTGVSVPGSCYRRGKGEEITEKLLVDAVGKKPEDGIYTIMLMHTPAGYEASRKWGADMTLCGHYHGGVIRFGHHGLITPQFRIFSAKCYGCYKEEKHTLIVTSGLGTHTLPLRFMNPAEFVEIHLL